VSLKHHGLASEIQIGAPVVGDVEFEKILVKAPTFFGMERIIRYSLLRFIHTHGIHIDARLDSNHQPISQKESTPPRS